jgi:Cu-Zn family superoxide dismutase
LTPARSLSVLIRFVAIAPLAAMVGCGEAPAILKPGPGPGAMGVARLAPKNGSTVRGFISFTQRGDRVAVAGNFVELFPGTHSLYIHAGGNCGSPNAASAGPVWNVDGASPGGKRTGDLPQLTAGSEGHAELQWSSSELSVGTGKPNDVLGHSVVVHAALDPDPKAQFGVPNGWLACGVIERSTGLDLKNIL